MECVVRLASLNIFNIKNVRKGQIVMPDAFRKQLSYKNAEVLGIYGQNGSGKTAVIDVMYYLQKTEKRTEIIRETLSCAINKDESRTSKTIFIDYQRSDRENIFTPKKHLEEVTKGNTENRTDLIVARKIAEKSNCSYIFGESSREVFP